MEIWKPIPNWEGYYEASNLGRIRAVDRFILDKNGNRKHHKQRIMSTSKHPKGYLRVSLTRDCKKETQQVHRLVALAFVTNPENKEQVNHKNGIKDDNHIDNLEWMTNDENEVHANENGLRNEIHHPREVAQYDLRGVLIATYRSLYQASKATGIKDSRIGDVCHGKRHTCYGFIFKFI